MEQWRKTAIRNGIIDTLKSKAKSLRRELHQYDAAETASDLLVRDMIAAKLIIVEGEIRDLQGGYTLKLIIEELHAAAHYLTKHPDNTAEQVGAFVGKSKRTIERWSTTAEWHNALDNLGFEGDRNWRRNPHRNIERDSGALVDLGKQTYLKYRQDGITKGKATTLTAKVLNVSEKTIYNYRKKFNWDA